MTFAAISVVEAECEKSSATTYFWYREALDISDSISESGGLNWKMTLCLLVAWSIVGMAVVKGIQSSGKVSAGGHPGPKWGTAERHRGHRAKNSRLPLAGSSGWVWALDGSG